MGILTNFLKLLKPEPNDFVDVAKHISENYDKLDENAKSNNETLTNLSNDKLDKGTYPGNASDLNTEISKIASATQLGRIKVGDNLTIDTAGRLSGNPAVDISGKMDKYKNNRYSISDYDDLVEDGFYIVRGSMQGAINAPSYDPVLVQVWNYGGIVYQNAVSYYDVKQQFTRCFKIETKNTKWESIVNTTSIVNNLTTTASGKVLDASQGKKLFDEKLDKGTYSGNAGDLKAEIDNKVSKSGDTMTGILTIGAPKYPKIIFNNIERAAVGYNADNKAAYFRAANGTGLNIYENNTATLQANNLNTKNKEVIAAINELNSRGFVKIGECLRVDQSVSINGYNEFVVCEMQSKDSILDIKYFTKDIVNSLKMFNFLSYSQELECVWVFSADGSTITLKDLGRASDGGIYVYGR